MSAKTKDIRMYHVVMYNLSGIQKGIQAGHAALEYADLHAGTEMYREFIKDHKTWIILDGGGSKEMEEYLRIIKSLGVPHAFFREPDLNDAISAITFLYDAKSKDAANQAGIFLKFTNLKLASSG